jgi:hypothetical protein
MATNNEFLSAAKDVLSSVKAEYHVVLGSDTISQNTKHTKSYNLRKEIKRLSVIVGLLSTVKEDDLERLMAKDKTFKESLLSILNPEDGGTRISVSAGDAFMDLVFNKYANAKDVVARINKAAESAGLVLDSKTNIFVKKI